MEELIDGLDLQRLVKKKGPLPWREACGVVRQAALGLQHLHERGLVHRDVKPSNLMLAGGGREPPGGTVKLLDLGLRGRFGKPDWPAAEPPTAPGFVVGTPDYVTPEQWAGLTFLRRNG